MRTPEEIRDRVRGRYTGNRSLDLAGFAVDELELADEEWRKVAGERYEAYERARKLFDRY